MHDDNYCTELSRLCWITNEYKSSLSWLFGDSKLNGCMCHDEWKQKKEDGVSGRFEILERHNPNRLRSSNL